MFSNNKKVIQIQMSADGRQIFILTKEGKIYVGKVYKQGESGDEYTFVEMVLTL